MNVKRIALLLRNLTGKDDRFLLRRKYFGCSLRANPAHSPITSTALDHLLNRPQVSCTGKSTHNFYCGVPSELRNMPSQVLVQSIAALLADHAKLIAVTRIKCAIFHNLSMSWALLDILHPKWARAAASDTASRRIIPPTEAELENRLNRLRGAWLSAPH
jgi:hypothetical protein